MLSPWCNQCWDFDLWFLCLSKPNLYIWKFSMHVVLKPSLKDFEHNLASMWNESSCMVVWTFFGIACLWHWNENWPFPVLWTLRIFQICWYIECSTLTASSVRIWNSSARIPSPPLALFVVMLTRPTWLCTPRCLALGEWSHHRGYLGHEDLFRIVLLCILATSSYSLSLPLYNSKGFDLGHIWMV